ncbi:MAG: nicotinamide riboside transporter PnuC [Helicobacteraceae bacterium]|nr:nicotinamide riboside transporter PnuC [Helicobacteraceae bacterium]
MTNKITIFSNLNLGIRFYLTLSLTCIIVLYLAYIAGGGILNLFAGLCGILYIFFAGRGKNICFIFGILYSCIYAFIAYKENLYGEVMLNLFYLPFNFAGLFLWKKNQCNNKIIILHLPRKQMLFYGFILIISSIIYGIFLQNINADFAYLNAFSVVAQIMAFYLQVKRYVENYLLVTFANIASIIFWGAKVQESAANLAQLITYIIFLILGIRYLMLWNKEAK